ncbi:MAG TPA: oligosaccharide flippase family protein [Puia sp.]|nr:oligosaccharide flippase family protein [Puia sp.]
MSIFKKYSYWVHSGKYTVIQKFSVLALGIVSFMMLARILEPSGFGVWGLFLVITSITETARTALIRNAFIRFMHQTEETEHGKLQSAAFMLSLWVSLGLSLFFLLLAGPAASWLKAPPLASMLRWYSVTVLFTVLFSQEEMLLNAKMDFRGICWIYCIRQGLLVGAIGACMIGKWKISPSSLSIFYMFSVLAGGLVGIWFCRPYIKWDFRGYRPWMAKLWQFGKFVFGTNISSLLFRSTDNFITSNYFGTVVSAYYNACLRIGNLVDIPSQVLGDLLFPKAAKYNSTDKAAIKHIYERTVGAILIFSMPSLIVLLLIPNFILHVLVGSKFLVAAPVLRITAFFGFTLPFLKQFGTIMDATGHPDINCRVMVVALGIDILANLVGIHFFGVIGAAIGTATTYFIICIVMQVILYRKFGVEFLNAFKNAFSLYGEIFASGRLFFKNRGKNKISSI